MVAARSVSAQTGSCICDSAFIPRRRGRASTCPPTSTPSLTCERNSKSTTRAAPSIASKTCSNVSFVWKSQCSFKSGLSFHCALWSFQKARNINCRDICLHKPNSKICQTRSIFGKFCYFERLFAGTRTRPVRVALEWHARQIAWWHVDQKKDHWRWVYCFIRSETWRMSIWGNRLQ